VTSSSEPIPVNQIPNLVFTPPADANGDGLGSISFQVIDGSSAIDGTPNTFTIDVTPVADDPVGSDLTLAIDEDQSLSFTADNFGFSDVDGDGFASVEIVSIDGAGTLTLNDVDITDSLPRTIAVSQISELVYVPPADANGDGFASINFQVIDDSSAVGDQDQTANAITINVNPIADDPAGINSVRNVAEDQSLRFTEADFGFSDVDGDGFASVEIVSINGAGTLTLGDADITNSLPRTIDVEQISDLLYLPPENLSGDLFASINFQVIDDSSVPGDQDQTANTITINVIPQSDEPTGASATIPIVEGSTFVFSSSNFGFSDADGDEFASVRILSFNDSGLGALTFDGEFISPSGEGVTVPISDISLLSYTPAENENGEGLATIEFLVSDDGGAANSEDLTIRELTFDVTPVNDAPAGSNTTLSGSEDSPLNFTVEDFGFSDVDGDAFEAIRISNFEGGGVLTLNEVEIALPQEINVSQIPNLVYRPLSDENGLGVASFDFVVIDGSSANNEDQTPNRITIDLDSVGDNPTGVSSVITILEDSIYEFDAGDFGFSDVDGDTFESVRIVSFSDDGSGALTLNGANVQPDAEILLSQIPLLRYAPGANQNGDQLATVEFRVVDDSNTSNEDLEIRSIEFNVQAVSDRPTGESQTLTIREDETASFNEDSFGFESVDGTDFQGVRIVDFSGDGQLTLNDDEVVRGSVINETELANLVFQPDAIDVGPAAFEIDFRVLDVSNGGFEELNTQTITFNVEAIEVVLEEPPEVLLPPLLPPPAPSPIETIDVSVNPDPVVDPPSQSDDEEEVIGQPSDLAQLPSTTQAVDLSETDNAVIRRLNVSPNNSSGADTLNTDIEGVQFATELGLEVDGLVYRKRGPSWC